MSPKLIKYVFPALLLVCQIGYAAEEWLEMQNKAGGRILLLSGKCTGRGSENGRMVITTTPAGPNMHGCWYVFAEMIHIVWEDKSTSSFNPDDFVYKKAK